MGLGLQNGEKGNGGYPRDNRGPRYGSISVLYDNELYDVRDKHPAFRPFRVAEAAVWKNLWLVIRPPAGEHGTDQIGVYPRADRSSLMWYTQQHGAEKLPLARLGRQLQRPHAGKSSRR